MKVSGNKFVCLFITYSLILLIEKVHAQDITDNSSDEDMNFTATTIEPEEEFDHLAYSEGFSATDGPLNKIPTETPYKYGPLSQRTPLTVPYEPVGSDPVESSRTLVNPFLVQSALPDLQIDVQKLRQFLQEYKTETNAKFQRLEQKIAACENKIEGTNNKAENQHKDALKNIEDLKNNLKNDDENIKKSIKKINQSIKINEQYLNTLQRQQDADRDGTIKMGQKLKIDLDSQITNLHKTMTMTKRINQDAKCSIKRSI